MGFVDKWPSKMQGSGREGMRFQLDLENHDFFMGAALARIYPPKKKKARKGRFNGPLFMKTKPYSMSYKLSDQLTIHIVIKQCVNLHARLDHITHNRVARREQKSMRICDSVDQIFYV
jgi:hypothetical protein